MQKVSNQLLHIKDLTEDDIAAIFENASRFKEAGASAALPDPTLANKTAILAFFEDSTRTSMSFQMACARLGIRSIRFSSSGSSQSKGESDIDTLENLSALEPEFVVLRHSSNDLQNHIPVLSKSIFINAGNGTDEHPTQALLDAFTLVEAGLIGPKKSPRVLIVGDIAHSRVAHSNISLLSRLGAQIVACTPKNFPMPESIPSTLEHSHDFDEEIKTADVVMLLRIQFERHKSELVQSREDYFRTFGLSKIRESQMKKNSVILHPGPLNRGIEIDSNLIHYPRSKILAQVSNGVYVRMAVLAHLGSKK